MNQTELEKYLWGAATYLRGKIDAGDYKQYIFPLLFYKRICDVYDEEFENALSKSDNDIEYASFAENHHFQIPVDSHWKKVREVTVNVGIALRDAMSSIEKANPNTLTDIFGDASWTNKDRLSDEILINLIEHYSKHKLNLSNVPDDQLGNAYEFLIKKFADDSGHTAAEFYTNRTVVKLMTMIMSPQPGESVYDPTCGSGGLLLNCALHLKSEQKEYRTLKLYGQEVNLITSSIARMNMFLHGIEEFSIIRGDTLVNPAFIEKDKLKKFDIILANPPYSIKSWDQKLFSSDPYGRNIWGTPPQGCADYAFQQHIQKSLKNNGRYAILWPHGILFREMEKNIRCKMVKEDTIEAVIGLGQNLFYNSPMEAMILIGNSKKSNERKGKILFVNAKKLVVNNQGYAYLNQSHINEIYQAYKKFSFIKNFANVVATEDILSLEGDMNINHYVKQSYTSKQNSFSSILGEYNEASIKLKKTMSFFFKTMS